MAGKKRLGELLLETGLLGEEELTRALAEQRTRRGKLGEVIVSLGLASEEEVSQALSLQLGIPLVDLTQTPVEPQAIELIPEKVARKHLIVPISIDQKDLVMAMADPLSFEAFEDVRFASGYTIRPAIATRSGILWAIDRHYHLGSSLTSLVKDIALERTVEVLPDPREPEGRDSEDLRRRSEAAPIIRMVNAFVAAAVDQGASDIHVEPHRSSLLVRNRVDGMLRNSLELPKWVQGAAISRIKIMAKMDIAEKRLPQDGRIGVRVGSRSLDLRVSTLPSSYGEKVVIRILDSAASQIPLEGMGISPEELERLEELYRRPQGILLVTGPTGSGKTTTLYGILNRIRSPERNITTIEDPVEYEIPGITQVAVQDRIGLTFPSLLRAILRQDPDVIMVGEMRDPETATIAMQAALTGHLVFSTMHTNHTVATVTRLRDLGIPSYLVASTIHGIVAQRLLRMVCTRCRVAADPPEKELRRLGLAGSGRGARFSRGEGCPACGGTGYRGRTGVFEILPFTAEVRDRVAAEAPEAEIRRIALASGMVPLHRAAMEKALQGITTIEEIFRVIETERDPGASCPACGGAVGPEYLACPSCGTVLRSGCPGCGRPASPGWKVCPYCRHGLPGELADRTTA